MHPALYRSSVLQNLRKYHLHTHTPQNWKEKQGAKQHERQDIQEDHTKVYGGGRVFFLAQIVGILLLLLLRLHIFILNSLIYEWYDHSKETHIRTPYAWINFKVIKTRTHKSKAINYIS